MNNYYKKDKDYYNMQTNKYFWVCNHEGVNPIFSLVSVNKHCDIKSLYYSYEISDRFSFNEQLCTGLFKILHMLKNSIYYIDGTNRDVFAINKSVGLTFSVEQGESGKALLLVDFINEENDLIRIEKNEFDNIFNETLIEMEIIKLWNAIQ